ncbi:MAG: type I DNA topoisomerase [Gemmatimonadetes bacterium]|nr:type I DNA topoisomerase [Gemmatimonadota bacterium]
MASLVIVESPTKARTIREFLPRGYKVVASMGHVRDLPDRASDIPAKLKGEEWSRLGVNVEQDFEPLYIVPSDKRHVVKELKTALDDADELILATDEDREGESISWHLMQVLKPKVSTRRMVFHEITREAIRDALDHTRPVDDRLVRAQETRRILDRLFGYTLSPLLWKKIAYGLSAGRVQSVAVRLLVIRERERRAFVPATYWDLKAALEHDGQGFEATLATLGGKRLATGKDFDERTGKLLAGRDVVLLDQSAAEALTKRLERGPWTVVAAEEKPFVRRPAPPFITSTLQQEANRKLRLSAREAMRTAQKLYEEGFITYMRTDSVHLSNQALTAARECVERLYGGGYLPPQPRTYLTGNATAQEAHEAIRPAGSHFRTPEETGLSGRELAVYDLIWKRTVASQMLDARLTGMTVTIDVADAGFRATGKRIDFPGFLRAYVEGSDDPEAALEDQEIVLPHLEVGDRPRCQALEALSHETQPPARYTEASLVKELEADGVGRPSTYASIIDTIIDRGYVQKQGQALVPTLTAFGVTALLEHHFPTLVDIKFTAGMEQTLDDISEGHAEWLPYLKEFYLGKAGLKQQVAVREKKIDPAEARTIDLGGLPDATIKLGRFGPYVEVVTEDGEVLKASVPRDAAPADLSREVIDEVLRQKAAGPDIVGNHPESGAPILLLNGQYGPYVQLGTVSDDNPKPKRASLPKGVTPDQVTLDMAVGLLALPRLLGPHPETGANVLAGQGRFGPYVVHDQGKVGKDYRSIKGEDHVLTITLARALELLAQPKLGRGRRAAPAPLRDLGNHPADGQPVGLFDGKYGPYVKHGSTSASIPKDRDPGTVTLAESLEWIEARGGLAATAQPRAKGKGGPRSPKPPKARTAAKPTAAAKKSATTQPPRAKPKTSKRARAGAAKRNWASQPDPLTARVKRASRPRRAKRRPTKARSASRR